MHRLAIRIAPSTLRGVAAGLLAAAALTSLLLVTQAGAQEGGNHVPVVAADGATTAEDTAIEIDVLANDSDPDGDPLTVTSLTQGAHGSAAVTAGGKILYTPAANVHGSDSFTYTAGDGNGGEATATVSVTVTPVNDPPLAGDDVATTAIATAVVVSVLANDTDADGGTLSVLSAGTPSHGSLVLNADQTITYTPNAGFEGDDTFTYVVSDGQGGTDTGAVTVTVGADNDDDEQDDDEQDDEHQNEARHEAKQRCKDGGWSELGFRNQGLCIKFNGDAEAAADFDGPPWPLLSSWEDREHGGGPAAADDTDDNGRPGGKPERAGTPAHARADHRHSDD